MMLWHPRDDHFQCDNVIDIWPEIKKIKSKSNSYLDIEGPKDVGMIIKDTLVKQKSDMKLKSDIMKMKSKSSKHRLVERKSHMIEGDPSVYGVGFVAIKLSGNWMAENVHKMLRDGIDTWAPKHELEFKSTIVNSPSWDESNLMPMDALRRQLIILSRMHTLEYGNGMPLPDGEILIYVKDEGNLEPEGNSEPILRGKCRGKSLRESDGCWIFNEGCIVLLLTTIEFFTLSSSSWTIGDQRRGQNGSLFELFDTFQGCEIELVKLPKEKRVISCKWLFKVKDGIPGVESKRYKARYVVRGFDQREGIDFNEVFSPVVRHTSIRVLLSIVALQDLELEQLDVKTAFLHGHLEEEIYVEQPEGFKVPGREDHVCKLKKSLYGLKQSPRQWYKSFDSFVIGHGYDHYSYDECVYLRKFRDGSFLYLVLYVDDMLIAAPNKDQIWELKDQLSNKFDMKDLGAAKNILAWKFKEIDKWVNLFYHRPITFQKFSRMSRYMHNPGKMHWEAVKCILCYLKGASNIGLSFEKSRASPNGVVGYVDSDYAGDLDARKSLSS
ncbi:retrovirus-related pol polyprotein from transposon TNT 1-94 [Tanacetum coccineum]